MKKMVFSVRDEVAGVFGDPFVQRSHGEAMRTFMDACEDQKTLLGRHPENFKLMVIGQFDDDTGVIEPVAVDVAMDGGVILDMRKE